MSPQSLQFFLGLLVLLLVDIIWVGSSELSEYIFRDTGFSKPFFSTYLKTSLFSIYLLGFIVWPPWREQCSYNSALRYSRLRRNDDGSEAQQDDEEESSELSSPQFEPVKMADADKTSDGETETTSSGKSVRFNRIAEVRQLPQSDGMEALISRLSFTASLRAQQQLYNMNAALPVRKVVEVAFYFCLLWFLGNYSYQMALSISHAGVVNVVSSTSGLFTLLLAAIFPSSNTDRFTLSKLCTVMVMLAGVSMVSLEDIRQHGAHNESLALSPDPHLLQPLYHHTPHRTVRSLADAVHPSVHFDSRQNDFMAFMPAGDDSDEQYPSVVVSSQESIYDAASKGLEQPGYVSEAGLENFTISIPEDREKVNVVASSVSAQHFSADINSSNAIENSTAADRAEHKGRREEGSTQPSVDDNHKSTNEQHVLSAPITTTPIAPGIPGINISGVAWALCGAVLYACYMVFLRRKVKKQDQIDIPMFFGFVGLFNTLLLWPLFMVLHITGWEIFMLPTRQQLLYIIVNGLIGTVLSELLWIWGCFLTSSLLATLSLSLTIPLSMLCDVFLRGVEYSWLFYAGMMPIVFSFVAVTVLTHYDNWDPLGKLCHRGSSSDHLRAYNDTESESLIVAGDDEEEEDDDDGNERRSLTSHNDGQDNSDEEQDDLNNKVSPNSKSFEEQDMPVSLEDDEVCQDEVLLRQTDLMDVSATATDDRQSGQVHSAVEMKNRQQFKEEVMQALSTTAATTQSQGVVYPTGNSITGGWWSTGSDARSTNVSLAKNSMAAYQLNDGGPSVPLANATNNLSAGSNEPAGYGNNFDLNADSAIFDERNRNYYENQTNGIQMKTINGNNEDNVFNDRSYNILQQSQSIPNNKLNKNLFNANTRQLHNHQYNNRDDNFSPSKTINTDVNIRQQEMTVFRNNSNANTINSTSSCPDTNCDSQSEDASDSNVTASGSHEKVIDNGSDSFAQGNNNANINYPPNFQMQSGATGQQPYDIYNPRADYRHYRTGDVYGMAGASRVISSLEEPEETLEIVKRGDNEIISSQLIATNPV